MAFKNDSTPDLIAKSSEVVQVYTPELHAYLISLIPTPEGVRADHDRLASSFAASLADPAKAQECEADRCRVNDFLSILLGAGKAVSIKDPQVPEKLRLAHTSTKIASAMAPLLAPEGLKLSYNKKGQRVLSSQSVQKARGYQVWGCEGDPNIPSNWRLLTSSPGCRGILITGLNTTNGAYIKMRALRRKGEEGPWSHLVPVNPA